MNVPVSERLKSCASLVAKGARCADIGTDHGYLPVWLLQNGIASHVIASDIREKPLQKAIMNAEGFGTAGETEFRLCSGLSEIYPHEVDTVIIAGMGGDTIAQILGECSWLKENSVHLILQPQTSGNDLRRWLTENGWLIRTELLGRDNGFLYFVIDAVPGDSEPLSPGFQYVGPQLVLTDSPLLPAYIKRVRYALEKTVSGIRRSSNPDEARLLYYSRALAEVTAMEEKLHENYSK